MKTVKPGITCLFATAITMLSTSFISLAAESDNDFGPVTIGEAAQTLYISPLWLISDGLDQLSGGDAYQSMAVAGDVIYISDSSSSNTKVLHRYGRNNGSRLTDLAITYPSDIQAPSRAITHVGTDDSGILYVWAELPDGASPLIDIDVINPTTGEVTRRITHDLQTILPERYLNISSIHFGHPQITGSLDSGNYELALTETFSTVGSNTVGIRLWRVPMTNGVADDPRASKLLLPSDEDEGRIDAFIPVDPNARVTMIDDRKSIIDDGVNLPMYFRVRNLGVQVNSRLAASDGTSPEPKASGVTIFNWGPYRLMVYGNSVMNSTNFVVAHWKDTSEGINGGNIEKLWTLPKSNFNASHGTKPATLSCALPHEGNDKRTDLYVYSSGNGLGAYAIGDTRYSGTTDLPEMKFEDQSVSIQGATITLTYPEAVEVVSIDGKSVMTSQAAISHDLSNLHQGVYIVKIADRLFKIYIP